MAARRWQAPRASSLLLAAIGVASFFALGAWQVRRAHEKEALFAAFDAVAGRTPLTLERARAQAGATSYPLVEVAGTYDAEHAYVLDDQVRAGKAGIVLFNVFSPSAGGVSLLVARGFLARDTRGAMPRIPAPPAGVRMLHALYAPPPGSGLRMGGNALPRQAAWPKTAIYLDLAEVSADLGRTLDPRVLLETDAEDAAAGFVREWRPDVFPPARHYAYAFTWFAFCLVVVATFIGLHWKGPAEKRRRDDGAKPEH